MTFLKLNIVCLNIEILYFLSVCRNICLIVCLCGVGVGAGVTVFAYTIISFRINTPSEATINGSNNKIKM